MDRSANISSSHSPQRWVPHSEVMLLPVCPIRQEVYHEHLKHAWLCGEDEWSAEGKGEGGRKLEEKGCLQQVMLPKYPIVGCIEYADTLPLFYSSVDLSVRFLC